MKQSTKKKKDEKKEKRKKGGRGGREGEWIEVASDSVMKDESSRSRRS